MIWHTVELCNYGSHWSLLAQTNDFAIDTQVSNLMHLLDVYTQYETAVTDRKNDLEEADVASSGYGTKLETL